MFITQNLFIHLLIRTNKYSPILATLADNIQIPIMNGVCTLSKSTIAIGNSIGLNIVSVGGGASFSLYLCVSYVVASVAIGIYSFKWKMEIVITYHNDGFHKCEKKTTDFEFRLNFLMINCTRLLFFFFLNSRSSQCTTIDVIKERRFWSIFFWSKRSQFY